MAAPFLLPQIRVVPKTNKHDEKYYDVFHGKRTLDRKHVTGVRDKYIIEHLGNKYILKVEGYGKCNNHHQTESETRVWRTLPRDLIPHFVPILKFHVTKHGGWSLQPYIEDAVRPSAEQWKGADEVYKKGTGCLRDCRSEQAFIHNGVICFHDYGFTEHDADTKRIRKRTTIKPR